MFGGLQELMLSAVTCFPAAALGDLVFMQECCNFSLGLSSLVTDVEFSSAPSIPRKQ